MPAESTLIAVTGTLDPRSQKQCRTYTASEEASLVGSPFKVRMRFGAKSLCVDLNRQGTMMAAGASGEATKSIQLSARDMCHSAFKYGFHLWRASTCDQVGERRWYLLIMEADDEALLAFRYSDTLTASLSGDCVSRDCCDNISLVVESDACGLCVGMRLRSSRIRGVS